VQQRHAVMECTGCGIDCGTDLRFGDGAAVPATIPRIARGEGCGDVLA